MYKGHPLFLAALEAHKEGTTCQNCGQHAKVYNRNIHSTTAAQLIKAYHLGASSEFIHVSKLLFKGASGIGDFPKAVYWGMIEEMPNNDPDKRSSGFWKLTHMGVDFVLGKVGIPKYARVYNGELLNPPFVGPTVYIRDCLGSKWSYSELMNHGEAHHA